MNLPERLVLMAHESCKLKIEDAPGYGALEAPVDGPLGVLQECLAYSLLHSAVDHLARNRVWPPDRLNLCASTESRWGMTQHDCTTCVPP